VNGRLALLVLALSIASGIAVLGSVSADAADPTDRVVRIGLVIGGSPSTHQHRVNVFWDRLRELGWVEGQNLAIEQRWAEGRMERLPALMTEVLAHRIDVLVTHSTPGAVAAKNATSVVPIVVANMGDPIGTGLASSLARPGGNLTGLSTKLGEGFGGKWLELLHEAIPRLSTVAVIYHPDSSFNRGLVEELKNVGLALSIKLRLIDVREPEALDKALEQARRTAQAVLVPGDLFTERHRNQIIALTVKHRLPTIFGLRSFVDAGGLMSYGVERTILFRRAADYVDKILRGAKPADLPIEQPTTFTLVVNLKTAKALGITIPDSILLRADEVIR
jgi:putative tryptophan/tyrosine transport system substrate-binding protein